MPDDDVGGRLARQDGDAVVGLLAEMHGFGPERLDGIVRKLFVGQLEFLQGEASTGWSASHWRR